VREISCSSKHPGGTWLGRGMMHVLSPTVFQDMLKEQQQQQQLEQQQQQQQASVPPPAPVPAAAADAAVPTSPSDISSPPQEATSAVGEAAGADGTARLAGQANSVIQLLSQLTTAVEAANTAVATARAAAAAHQVPYTAKTHYVLRCPCCLCPYLALHSHACKPSPPFPATAVAGDQFPPGEVGRDGGRGQDALRGGGSGGTSGRGGRRRRGGAPWDELGGLVDRSKSSVL